MKNPSAQHSEIAEILKEKDYKRLEPYKESASWTQVTGEGKNLLAEAFIGLGEEQLSQGDSTGYQSLELASQLAPTHPTLWFLQGCIFSEYDHNEKCLERADLAFRQSSVCDPSPFLTWYRWGSALFALGKLKQDFTFLSHADEKFAHAESLFQNEVSREEFYTQWARTWAFMASLSGEAVDWSRVLEKFEQATEGDKGSPSLWLEYGEATMELASLLSHLELVEKAIAHYRKATQAAPDSLRAWYSLALALKSYYMHTAEEKDFQEADAAFSQAVELDPDHAGLWRSWGQVLVDFARIYKHEETLERTVPVLNHAYELDPHDPETLSSLAEAYMMLGAETERLDYLRLAEEKILRSLELLSDNPDHWYIYGCILNELGRYFRDTDYYCQAIDRLQYGLSLSERHPMLWYGLAQAHIAVGDINGDLGMMEKAVAYCGQAMQCGGDKSPQFWNDWGLALTKLGDYTHQERYFAAAVQRFEQAIKMAGDFADADLEWLYNYGCALDFLGDFRDEEKCYEKAVQVLSYVLEEDEEFLAAKYNLGLALSHYGEVTGDLESVQRASLIFEELTEADGEDEVVYNDWGVTLMHHAQMIRDPVHMQECDQLFKEAETKLLKALSLGSTSALYNMACLCSLTGHTEMALHFLEKAQSHRALPPVEDMLGDMWLEGMRENPQFKRLLSQWAHLNNE